MEDKDFSDDKPRLRPKSVRPIVKKRYINDLKLRVPLKNPDSEDNISKGNNQIADKHLASSNFSIEMASNINQMNISSNSNNNPSHHTNTLYTRIIPTASDNALSNDNNHRSISVNQRFDYDNNFHNGSFNSLSVSNRSYFCFNQDLTNETNHLKGSFVKNYIPKIPDDNLIDLDPFGSEISPDFNNVLLLFDPLLSGSKNKSDSYDKKDSSANFVHPSSKNFDPCSLPSPSTLVKNELIPVNENTKLEIKKSDPYSPSSRESNDFKVGEFRVKERNYKCDNELVAFVNKLKKIRLQYSYDNKQNNLGFVISPKLFCSQEDSLSVKLQIRGPNDARINFTCNVNANIEHVIFHAVCSLYEDTNDINFEKYILKVNSKDEYLIAGTRLGDYAYVHHCHVFDEDVRLTLVEIKSNEPGFYARTKEDDERVMEISPNDLMPQLFVCNFSKIDTDTVNILLETIEKEIEKMVISSSQEGWTKCIKCVCQSVKALCSLLGNLDTIQLTEAIENLSQISLVYDEYQREKDGKSLDTLHQEVFHHAIFKLKKSVCDTINLYCKAFPVEFEMVRKEESIESEKSICYIKETFMCYIGTVNSLPFDWKVKYREFFISSEVMYGDRIIGYCTTIRTTITQGLFPRLLFNDVLHFELLALQSLPREAVLKLTLYGIESISDPSSSEVKKIIGVTGMKLFDFNGQLIKGSILLGLWIGEIVGRFTEILACGPCMDKSCPIVVINLRDYGGKTIFPSIDHNKTEFVPQDLRLLDSVSKSDIHNILNSDPLTNLSKFDQSLIWEKRNYLHTIPNALPMVIKAVPSWKWDCLHNIYDLVDNWNNLSPIDAMSLLLPIFPDRYIRSKAVEWIGSQNDETLIDYLPQLIQALRYELHYDCELIWLLLKRCYSSVGLAHSMYWLLKQNVNDILFSYKSRIYLNALLSTCGAALNFLFTNQESLLDHLSCIPDRLKASKESSRQSQLIRDLEPIEYFLESARVVLPLSLGMKVVGFDLSACSYFTSNNLPLKLVFKSDIIPSKSEKLEAIYKVGDDLRQDSLTMQIISIMDKLWLKEGLDLKIITFGCIATDVRKGFIEVVKDAETLRKIQSEFGITGSFKDCCIAEWLQKYNTSELEYQQAVDNFTLSLAGYVVATYILGICDRHNDNIMVTKSGHLFHIDFGKYLGDAQMLGSIKRDRTPFILTNDMAYVINGGCQKSTNFQNFVDVCCHAFNIIRRHSNVLVNLFSLMVSSGIPGLTPFAVKYVHGTLLTDLTESEATSAFNKMIEESLKSVFTRVNFFVHNLAQMRFSGDWSEQSLLSFVPRKYTKEEDGRIIELKMEGVFKKVEPVKVYYYRIKVVREHQVDPSHVYRSYREFYELYQKMVNTFPLVTFYPLKGHTSLISRSNTLEVAEKRKNDVNEFLSRLLIMGDEIAHNEIVYTFFHPILRDQETSNFPSNSLGPKRKSPLDSSKSSIKLSIVYKDLSLIIMVKHATNLTSQRSSQKKFAPDCYAKSYLLPDSNKSSKRKTRVVYASNHPTFMEMIVYNIPKHIVKSKVLEVSVWDYDRVEKNIFLGHTMIPLDTIDLDKETINWYPLT